jgi:ATP-dependent DNA helicase DinG
LPLFKMPVPPKNLTPSRPPVGASALLEVQVHHLLRQLLRDRWSGSSDVRVASGTERLTSGSWSHQLTMARLVARALRLQQPAVIQTGLPPTSADYAISYLVPALLWPGNLMIVAAPAIHQRLLGDLPQLQAQLGIRKTIDRQIAGHGLLLISPEQWLTHHHQVQMPVLIDGADRLEQWVHDWLQVQITPLDWGELMLAVPQQAEEIRDRRVRLTKSIFQRPVNPYNCYLLTAHERQLIPRALTRQISDDWLMWAKLDRSQGLFTLSASQIEINTNLTQLWARQSHILIGSVLDVDSAATSYRQELGLGELTCVKFMASRRLLPQLYVPTWVPMPNTYKFQEIFLAAALRLVAQRLQPGVTRAGLIVIVIGDTPLKTQIAAQVAAEYGSRVQVEKNNLLATNILITGWEFWNDYQEQLPSPQLLIIATLPIPSLEDPLVAAKVNCYKRQRQDWFRCYLLPVGLRVLQRSILTVRQSSGLVAIFDNRINQRSYGKQVLSALHPIHRVDTPELR